MSRKMERFNKSLPTSFVTLGAVFLVLGFVQQGLAINFESEFFTLGILFIVGGLATLFLEKNRGETGS